jgi:hypothetical protein
MSRESTLDRPLPNSQLERQNDALAPPSINPMVCTQLFVIVR